MRPELEVPADALELAREMRATTSKGWNTIAREIGYGGREHFIRKRIDPGYAEKHREYALRRSRVNLDDVSRQPQRCVVPEEVAAERNRAYEFVERSVTEEFCGDPLPGRSALDQRLGR